MTTYGDTTAWIKIEQWSQSNIRILTIAFDVFLATVSSSKLADLYSSFGWTHFLLQAWAITQFPHYERDHPIGSTSKLEMTSDGKYKCEFCDRMYNRSHNLFKHQREKHDIKPRRKENEGRFACDICDKRKSSKQMLRYHKKAVHGVAE